MNLGKLDEDVIYSMKLNYLIIVSNKFNQIIHTKIISSIPGQF